MPLKVGDLAGDFELQDYDGNFYSLSLAEGYKLLIFYKTTCPTCQLTLPFMEKLHRLYGGSVRIWGVVQDPPQEAQGFAKKYGLSFPQLIDYPDYPASVDYHVEVVPTLYLISPEGKVEFVSQSFVRAEIERLTQMLASISGLAYEDIFAGSSVPAFKPG
jgi:peroxiredoxin